MEPYEHGGDIYGNPGVTIDFSVNTNPLGMPEAVRQALIDRVDEFSRYPDPNCRELTEAIAWHEAVPQDWILCGNGAADLIHRICHVLRPRRALVPAPAFSEYERALMQAGCQVLRHPLTGENGFELTEELTDEIVPSVDLVFLCHPNNPTGRLIQPEVMERVLARAREIGATVVADECFLEFTEGITTKRYLKETPGLVVLGAFTKLYAMAGLRLGYVLTSDRALLERLSAAAPCWSVSVPAQIAGVAALSLPNWAPKTRRFVAGERQFLSEALRGLGIQVFPSDANYLLLRCHHPLYEPLLQRGILLRRCGNFAGLDETYSRVAVKTREENTRLLEAMREVLNG